MANGKVAEFNLPASGGGTFKLTDEAIDAPPNALRTALAEAGIEQHRFRPLHPGEYFDVPEL